MVLINRLADITVVKRSISLRRGFRPLGGLVSWAVAVAVSLGDTSASWRTGMTCSFWTFYEGLYQLSTTSDTWYSFPFYLSKYLFVIDNEYITPI